MAKRAASFNFGANRKPRKKKPKKARSSSKKGVGNRSNAWRQYISTAPIPD